ncbi:hypothetical protein OF83DRAFT_1059655 [Amylostereum chailletii]|nr:hypothetical protein OF83DRAFT_1059655 [Amylostereum chailletii]
MSAVSGSEAIPSTIMGLSSAGETWELLLMNVGLFVSLIEGIGEIHPYAKMAASILSAVVKPILSQDKRDKAVAKLLETMRDVYAYLNASDELKNIDDHRKTVLQRISRQTVECAYFIRDYSDIKNFCKIATARRRYTCAES